MYKFEKYGALMKYNGIPVYIGNKCITERTFAWWWPLNWILILIALPIAFWRAVRR